MAKCIYCPDDGTQCICLGCRTKLEKLEAENVRLRKDVSYLRSLAAQHRHETRTKVHGKMKPQK